MPPVQYSMKFEARLFSELLKGAVVAGAEVGNPDSIEKFFSRQG